MKEALRVAKLADDLLEAWERDPETKKVRRVGRKDAVALAHLLHMQMDGHTEERDRHAADNDVTIACEQGCTKCCETIVFVFEAEAITVASWLSARENADALAWFEESYARWRVDVKLYPELAHQALLTNAKGSFDAALRKVGKQHVMCAFNRDGACTIYPVRPLYCRYTHAVDNADDCGVASEKPPQVMNFVSIEEFMSRARPLSLAVHSGLGKPKGIPTPLIHTVHRLLDAGTVEPFQPDQLRRKVGRNEPCPCGSGKKFKRCCGEP